MQLPANKGSHVAAIQFLIHEGIQAMEAASTVVTKVWSSAPSCGFTHIDRVYRDRNSSNSKSSSNEFISFVTISKQGAA